MLGPLLTTRPPAGLPELAATETAFHFVAARCEPPLPDSTESASAAEPFLLRGWVSAAGDSSVSTTSRSISAVATGFVVGADMAHGERPR